MKKFLCMMLILIPAGLSAAPTIDTQFDLRVRQESLQNVLFFTPDADQNWIRVRPRLAVGYGTERHDLRLRLCNEHRYYLTPDVDFDEDELIIDRLNYRWRADEFKLTIGRQDIIWNDGFLMMDAHPLDGSRSIYHNAARLQGRGLDAALIYNPRSDDLVLYNDQNRHLSDMDEYGLALKYRTGDHQFSVIYKDENSQDFSTPDLHSTTFAWRLERRLDEISSAYIEIALQNQRFDDQLTGLTPLRDGWPLAFETRFSTMLRGDVQGEFGAFHYSGANESHEAFRSPWGNWPSWSELYIYMLLLEGRQGDSRVHVASWENITAPYATFKHKLLDDAVARFSVYQLLAESPNWSNRGTLLQLELKFLLRRDLSGHLLWEAMVPGDFYDGLTEKTAHFLRWQVTYSL